MTQVTERSSCLKMVNLRIDKSHNIISGIIPKINTALVINLSSPKLKTTIFCVCYRKFACAHAF